MRYRIIALIGLSLLSTACSKNHDNQDQSASMTMPGKSTPQLCTACGQSFYGYECPHVVCK